MSNKHGNRQSKNQKHQNKAQQVSQRMAETERYDRSTVIDWCLDWSEHFRKHGDISESAIAFDWADWCETAPTAMFNQVCDQWSAWTAQQTVNSSVYQGELL